MTAGGLFCIVLTVKKKFGGKGLRVPLPLYLICVEYVHILTGFARGLVYQTWPGQYVLDRPSSIYRLRLLCSYEGI